MESRKLEIILHSANDLLNVKFFGTMKPYAVVSITGGGPHKTFTTDVSKMDNGSYPVWNCVMQFDVVPMHNNYTLLFEIKHRGKLTNRKIGQVKIPFTDLLVGDASGKKISYPVTTSAGRINGEIMLSHKFSEPVVMPAIIMISGEAVGTSRRKIRDLVTQVGEVALKVFEEILNLVFDEDEEEKDSELAKQLGEEIASIIIDAIE